GLQLLKDGFSGLVCHGVCVALVYQMDLQFGNAAFTA
ncbi:MAG: hypothetical protein RLY90_751, partial [Pseudomonadota bacterium]